MGVNMKKIISFAIMLVFLISLNGTVVHAGDDFCPVLFEVFKKSYGSFLGDNKYSETCDFDKDDSVDLIDFAIFARNYRNDEWCFYELFPWADYEETIATGGIPVKDTNKKNDRRIKNDPEPPEDPWSLKVGIHGDTHAGYNGDSYFPPSKDIHEQIVAKFDVYNPDMILNLGDVIHNTGVNQWAKFDNIAGDLADRIPYYPVVGNHDGLQAYLNYFNNLPTNGDGTGRYYYVEDENSIFIFLDISDVNNACNSYNDQKVWMENVLDQHEDKKYKFVSFHLPLITTGGRGVPFNCRSTYNPIFESRGVDIVFAGHIHAYERFEINGVQYIISGGAGGFGCNPNNARNIAHCLEKNSYTDGFLPLRKSAAESYNYIKMELDEDKLELTTYDLNDNILDDFEIVK
jgi:predicted phosphodiesterase